MTIPYGHQSIDDDDIAAVVRTLKGEWLTQGPAVDEFEAALAEYTGARHAVVFANGTAALHAAAAVAGLTCGDRVAVPAITFVASANAARYVGATPVVVDVDSETLNVDLDMVPVCDALVAVHYAGLPVDLTALRHRPRVVIEDAAHALGAQTPDGPVGNCAHSDFTCFSFHPVKPITTFEGGAVTTNSVEYANALRRFRSHGIVPQPDVAPWYYEVEGDGFNYRLTDVAAALGTSQLAKLDRFVERRNELANRYDELLATVPAQLPARAPSGFRHGRHLYPVRVPNRDAVFAALRARGIGTQVHYVPLARHPVIAAHGNRPEDFPRAEQAYGRLLSLPLFPGLTDDEQRFVVDALRHAL